MIAILPRIAATLFLVIADKHMESAATVHMLNVPNRYAEIKRHKDIIGIEDINLTHEYDQITFAEYRIAKDNTENCHYSHKRYDIDKP